MLSSALSHYIKSLSTTQRTTRRSSPCSTFYLSRRVRRDIDWIRLKCALSTSLSGLLCWTDRLIALRLTASTFASRTLTTNYSNRRTDTLMRAMDWDKIHAGTDLMVLFNAETILDSKSFVRSWVDYRACLCNRKNVSGVRCDESDKRYSFILLPRSSPLCFCF